MSQRNQPQSLEATRPVTEANPVVTVVVVTYQSSGTIAAALKALRPTYEAGLTNAVVVDNASSDGTADLVAQQHPWVTLVRSHENLGFGRGCNLGFSEVQTPYVMFLNPDAVIGVEALRTLVDFMDQHPRVGIAAPATYKGDEILQNAGMMTTPWTVLRAALGKPVPYGQMRVITPGEPPFQTSWVCGAAMLIRQSLFRQLGGFDPRFFLYFEETDLCRRAVEQGAEIWAVGQAVAFHVGGVSAKSTGETMHSACISEHFFRSRFYYLVKHFGWSRAVAIESADAALQRVRGLRNLLTGRGAVSRWKKRPFLRLPDRVKETP